MLPSEKTIIFRAFTQKKYEKYKSTKNIYLHYIVFVARELSINFYIESKEKKCKSKNINLK